MIHVCYSLRDNSGHYSKYVGTSMLSIFENTHESVTIHLLHDSTLTEDNRKKFLKLVYNYEQDIIFYNVEDKIDEMKKNSTIVNSRFTFAAMYRLMIPDLINESKIIYLDADTIVNLDINELWNMDLKNYPLGAVTEISIGRNNFSLFKPVTDGTVDFTEYFGSGILLMNLDLIRGGGGLLEKALKILEKHPEYDFIDQDPLNVMFQNNYLKLQPKFNQVIVYLQRQNYHLTNEIYHYAADSTGMDLTDQFNQLWFKYFVKTPFCNENTFENIFNQITKFFDTSADIWRNFYIQSQSRKKIFFASRQDISGVTEYIGLVQGDIFLNADANDSINKLVQIYKAHNHIILLAVNDTIYSPAVEKLVAENLKYGIDFFDVRKFFKVSPDIYSNQFVKTM